MSEFYGKSGARPSRVLCMVAARLSIKLNRLRITRPNQMGTPSFPMGMVLSPFGLTGGVAEYLSYF